MFDNKVIGRFRQEKEAAMFANNHIIQNNLDKPLNIIPGLEFV